MTTLTKLFFAIVAVTFSVVSNAEQWAVGTVAEPNSPGLSIQRASDDYSAVHIAAHFFEKDRIMINGDYQRFYYPNFEFTAEGESRLGFYSGLGIKAESRKEEQIGEYYSLRLPVGVQWSIDYFYTQLFSDIALILGELPKTNLSMAARLGLRTQF